MTNPADTESSQNDDSLQATITSREGNRAVITTQDNQTLSVRTAYLPKDAGVGTVLWLAFHSSTMRETERREQARALLNEIMNPEI
jgi:hypothetical protein